MAASIAVVYPHMNGIGGDGFWLVREPSGRVRALMAAGRAGELARPELYREYETIPTRGALAALTVPGAISGWMLALEAAKAQGGALPLDVLLGHAIRAGRARARRCRAASPTSPRPSRASSNSFPALRRPSWSTARPPAAGHILRQPALAATLEQLAHAGLADFYRGDVGREVAGDLDRVGCAGDPRRSRAHPGDDRRAADDHDRRRHALQHAAADAGARLADDAGTVRSSRRQGGRELRSCARADRGGEAGAARARPRHQPIPIGCRSRPSASSPTRSSMRRPPPSTAQGRAVVGAARAGRHHLDGRRRRLRAGRLLHPVALLGVRLRRGAAAHRRADAEPRHRLQSLKPASRQPRSNPDGCRRTRSIRRWRCCATGGSWPMAPWAATRSRRSRPRCSPATCCSGSRSKRRSTGRAGSSGGPGAPRTAA